MDDLVDGIDGLELNQDEAQYESDLLYITEARHFQFASDECISRTADLLQRSLTGPQALMQDQEAFEESVQEVLEWLFSPELARLGNCRVLAYIVIRASDRDRAIYQSTKTVTRGLALIYQVFEAVTNDFIELWDVSSPI